MRGKVARLEQLLVRLSSADHLGRHTLSCFVKPHSSCSSSLPSLVPLLGWAADSSRDCTGVRVREVAFEGDDDAEYCLVGVGAGTVELLEPDASRCSPIGAPRDSADISKSLPGYAIYNLMGIAIQIDHPATL